MALSVGARLGHSVTAVGSRPGHYAVVRLSALLRTAAPDLDLREVLPRLTDEAIEVIADHAAAGAADPLMLYLAYPAPHTPWLPSPEFDGRSGAGMYGDFTVMVDAMIGRVLQALEDAQMADETLVIFSSDNGPVWYEEDVERFAHDSSGGLRGMKADAGPDSFDLLPVWLGDQPEAEPVRDSLVGASGNGAMSIRTGPWKLIDRLGSGGFSRPGRLQPTEGGPQGQLYNLDDDPGETQNLWQAYPEIVTELTNLLAKIRSEGRSRSTLVPDAVSSRILGMPGSDARDQARPAWR